MSTRLLALGGLCLSLVITGCIARANEGETAASPAPSQLQPTSTSQPPKQDQPPATAPKTPVAATKPPEAKPPQATPPGARNRGRER